MAIIFTLANGVMLCVCPLIDVTTSRNVSFVFLLLLLSVNMNLSLPDGLCQYSFIFVSVCRNGQPTRTYIFIHGDTGRTLPMDCIYLLIEI